MKPAQHPTAARTAQLLRGAGIDAQVVEFDQPTRTSAEAATAIGCSVAEIAKSIVFRGRTSGLAVVVVASGDNRVSEAKVAAKVDEPLARADADFVRMATGYAIGGVAPIGHRSRSSCCSIGTCSASRRCGRPAARRTRCFLSRPRSFGA